MSERMTPRKFIVAAREEFPELVPVLEEDEGVFYLQVGSLRSHTQAAIDDGDRAEVRRHFVFVRKASLAGDDEVQNALGSPIWLDEEARNLGVAPRKTS